MLSENPRVLDLNINYFENLLSLLQKKGIQKKEVLFLLFENNRILKAIHSEHGRIEIKGNFSSYMLKDISRKYNNSWVVAVKKSCLKKISSNFQKSVHYDENYVKQVFKLWKAISQEIGEGILEYPERLKKFKYLRYFLVEKIFRLVMPKEGSIIFVIFEKNKIFFSFIIEIVNYEVDLITTTEFFNDKIKIQNWKRDYKILLNKAKENLKKLYLGVFTDVQTIENIKTYKDFLKNIFLQNVILNPLPTRLSILLKIIKGRN